MIKKTILLLLISLFAVTMVHSEELNQKITPQVIILLGPPGSGKGTQAVQITKQLNIPHISTGDLFRENISKNTPLGTRAKEFMNAGKLVPDQIVLDMLSERITKPDCANGFLLDGFPRTIPQAEALDTLLDKKAKIVVVSLDVSDQVIMKRIEGRRLNDQKNGESAQRADDNPEVVKERLKVYHDQTAPLIQFYEKKGILNTIPGEQDPQAITQQIMKIVS